MSTSSVEGAPFPEACHRGVVREASYCAMEIGECVQSQFVSVCIDLPEPESVLVSVAEMRL